MHLFQSQDEQNTPEYIGSDGGMFGNQKKAQDPKSVNTLVSEVERMRFD